MSALTVRLPDDKHQRLRALSLLEKARAAKCAGQTVPGFGGR